MALARILGALLRNQRSVLAVSTLLDGEHGLHDVGLSVPCVVDETGVARVLEQSAAVLREAMGEIARPGTGRG